MSRERPDLKQPYLGLRPFDEPDAPLYFGREVQVDAALAQLEDHAFLAVVGSSGSGKSSLVKAGLLPAVRQGFLLSRKDWIVLKMRPGHEPYLNLARELAGVLPAGGREKAIVPQLRASERGLVAAINERAPSSAVLVVVDQFEELFAFRHASESRGEMAERDEAAAFVRMLLWSCSVSRPVVRVVLTMRSDFIGDCEVFLGLPEAISRSQFLVPRLDRSQLEEAITRPSQVRGAGFSPFTFERQLENRIINDAGDRPDQLPLMQHALLGSWKRAVVRAVGGTPVRVTFKDYEAAGEIESGLSLDADAGWLTVAEDPRLADLVRRVFLLLCDVSPDGQITRRRPRAEDVMRVTGAGLEELRAILRTFQQDDRNFLLPPADTLTAQSTLDIAHESLIRQWKTFNDWVIGERTSAATLVRLRERAQRWPAAETVLAGPALTAALAWRQTDRPTPAWAERYGGGLDDVNRYLDESSAEQQREVDRLDAERRREAEREEAERQRELADAQRREADAREREQEQRQSARRFRWLAMALAILAVLAIGVAAYAIRQERLVRTLSGGLEARDARLKERNQELGKEQARVKEQEGLLATQQGQLDEQRGQLTTQQGVLGTQRRQLDEQRGTLKGQATRLAEREASLVKAEQARTALAGQFDALKTQTDILAKQQRDLAARSVAMERLVRAGGVITDTRAGLNVELLSDDRNVVGRADAVVQALPELGPVHSLTLRRTRVTDAGLLGVAALAGLNTLDLSSTDVTDAGVEALLSLPRLQHLVLSDTLITQASLPRLARIPSLRRLEVSRTRMTAQAVQRFKEQHPTITVVYDADPLLEALADAGGNLELAIQRLDGALGRGSAVVFSGALITDAALKFLNEFTNITLISCPNITDDGLRNLRANRRLQKLTINKVGEITSRGLGYLADVDALRDLTIESQTLTPAGVEAVASIGGLRILHLASNEITDRAVALLTPLEQLEELSIALAPALTDRALESFTKLRSLRSLSLDRAPRLTGSGVGGLSALPALRELEIDGASLDDRHVDQLRRLTGLARLAIRDHDLSPQGVARLREGLRGVAVSVDGMAAVPAGVSVLRSDDDTRELRELPTGNRVLSVGPAMEGRLSSADRRIGGTSAQAWAVSGCDGRTIQIDLKSDDFDPVLFVSTPGADDLLANDDSEYSLDSRLTFRCDAGISRVIVTSIGGETGTFSLQATIPETGPARPARR
jgi:hypothetical protein